MLGKCWQDNFFFGGCSKLLSFIVTQNSQNYKYNLLGFFLNQREAIFSLLLSCDICGKEILISTAFLWLNNIPSCGRTTVCLFIHQLTDISVFPGLDSHEWCCCEHLCTSLCAECYFYNQKERKTKVKDPKGFSGCFGNASSFARMGALAAVGLKFSNKERTKRAPEQSLTLIWAQPGRSK